MFSGCESFIKDELIKELEAEIEAKTGEVDQLKENLLDVIYDRDSMKYERDAFLDENINLRTERKHLETRIEIYDETLEGNFNNYVQNRRKLGELIIYLQEIEATPYFDQEIRDAHKGVMREYINGAGADMFFVSDDEYTEFILSPIHIKNGNEISPGIFMYQTVLLGSSSPVEYPGQFSIPESEGSDFFDDVVFIVTETDSGPSVTYFGMTPNSEN